MLRLIRMKPYHPLLWSIIGAMFIVISIPFILELVPPNSISGFRVAKTFSDESIWYAANRVMGYDLLIAGVVICVAGIVTSKIYRTDLTKSNRLNRLVFVASLLIALAHSFWALARL
jgi:SdpI/YfhL protein family